MCRTMKTPHFHTVVVLVSRSMIVAGIGANDSYFMTCPNQRACHYLRKGPDASVRAGGIFIANEAETHGCGLDALRDCFYPQFARHEHHQSSMQTKSRPHDSWSGRSRG